MTQNLWVMIASYLGTGCGIISTGVLVHKKVIPGSIVGIIGSILYIYLGVKTGLYAIVVSNIFYIGLYTHGLYHTVNFKKLWYTKRSKRKKAP